MVRDYFRDWSPRRFSAQSSLHKTDLIQPGPTINQYLALYNRKKKKKGRTVVEGEGTLLQVKSQEFSI